MFSRYVASPCLHKILLTKFSSAKMFSHFVASPCLIVLAHNEAKIVSLVPRLPLGGKAILLPYFMPSPWGEGAERKRSG